MSGHGAHGVPLVLQFGSVFVHGAVPSIKAYGVHEEVSAVRVDVAVSLYVSSIMWVSNIHGVLFGLVVG